MIPALYAAVYPNGQLRPDNSPDTVMPTEYILRILKYAISPAHLTRAAKLQYRNTPPMHVDWMTIKNDEAEGRTPDEISTLYDQAMEHEDELEAEYHRVGPGPLAPTSRTVLSFPSLDATTHAIT